MPRRRNEATATSDSGKMTAISMRMTPKQLAQLKQRSRSTGLPMTELIRRAIDDYLVRTAKAAA